MAEEAHVSDQQIEEMIHKSDLLSRDLSWLKFNYRVLDQAKKSSRSILDRLKFIAITASNLDEFMMIRVGSLYNYLDYNKKRIDYSGLREWPFKHRLYQEIQKFSKSQYDYVWQSLAPKFPEAGFDIVTPDKLTEAEQRKMNFYFGKMIYPMLTPMIYDTFHAFPVLANKAIILGVLTENKASKEDEDLKYSFVQVPQNLPAFYEIRRNGQLILVPIERVIESNIQKLYKNIKIRSVSIFRLTRNGDFTYDDYDESEVDFVKEIQRKLKKRKTGRVVRLEVLEGYSKRIMKLLRKKYDIEPDNVFEVPNMLDFTRMWQVVKHKLIPSPDINPSPVPPLFTPSDFEDDIFGFLDKNDLLLHHPYHSMEPVMQMLEEAAVDPDVLAIKMTIYRLADDSRVTSALQQAAENGKHVSVLFEVKARFDEENNIQEGRRLQKAGCFVIYGLSDVKTHTKLLMIVRRSGSSVNRYVHMSSGNYNEDTASLYTDTSLMTSKSVYGNDVSEFFNVITGHSLPAVYKRLITTPGDMRKKLIRMIRKEISNAQNGKKAGIILKVNSLEDRLIIEELYKASDAGVAVKLIVRGICCIRPGRKGLSGNIVVKSIVGDNLEHSRIYYFHNGGESKLYGGSADIMVRSFDRRIESLFLVEGQAKKQMMTILDYSLRDEENSYLLEEDGAFTPVPKSKRKPFNVHKEFYNLKEEEVMNVKLF